MDFVEMKYYDLNRWLMVVIHCWPYKKNKLTRIGSIFVFFMFVTSLNLQIANLFIMKNDIDKMLYDLIASLVRLVCFIKYCTLYFQTDNIKVLFEHIKQDWLSLQAKENERNILKAFVNEGRLTIMFAAIVFVFLSITFVVIQLTPLFLDIVTPLNESRTRELVLPIYCFFDQEKYFLVVQLYEIVTIILGGVALLTTDITFFTLWQHYCGLFKIVGYRLEHSFDNLNNEFPNTHKNNDIYLNIINVVNMHRRAIWYFELGSTIFQTSYTVSLFIGMLSISLNLFYLYQSITMHNMKLVTIIVMLLFIQYSILYVTNSIAQSVMDHANAIFTDIYNVKWYEAPLFAQKLYLFLMLNCTKDTEILFGVFKPSKEGFCKLLKISVNYFMVLRSTRIAQ